MVLFWVFFVVMLLLSEAVLVLDRYSVRLSHSTLLIARNRLDFRTGS